MHPITRRHPRVAAGFTLIELLITVAIVAILMAVAIGSYDFAMVKARRGAAKACLTADAQFLERYYTMNFKYADATLPACDGDVADYYTIGFVTDEPTDETYKIQAVPKPNQADSKCGTLVLDNTGVKDAGDSTPATVDACW